MAKILLNLYIDDLREQFQMALCIVMCMDFWEAMIVEMIAKFLFSDVRPKGMVSKGVERREAWRRVQAQQQQEASLEQEKAGSGLSLDGDAAASSAALQPHLDLNQIRLRNTQKSAPKKRR